MSQSSDAHPLDLSSPKTVLGNELELKPELLIGLPDVPTLAILSLLPLQESFNLSLVHHRLVPILETLLTGNQCLVLHIGGQKEIAKLQFNSSLRPPFASHLVDSTGALLYPETDFHTLHLATLDEHSAKQLTRLMPSIVHLQVLIADAPISVLPQLAILLSRWAPSLQTLKLNIGPLNSPATTMRNDASCTIVSNLRSLIHQINSKLWALQTLTLDIGRGIGSWLNLHSDAYLFEDPTGVPLRLTILGQLRQFNLHLRLYSSAPNYLLWQLEQFATEKLTAIGLGGNFAWNLSQAASSQFTARFTRVPFNRSPTSHHTALLPAFSNLTVYAFNCKALNASELIAHLHALSTLPHLQFLYLDNFSPFRASPDLPSLGSVTVLEIRIFLETHENHSHLKMPYWAHLFPSVQILKVTHFRVFCAICHPDDWFTRQVITDYTQVTPCLRQLFAPLRDLPSLRKIFHQRANQFDLIAEFTPQGEFVRTHEYIG